MKSKKIEITLRFVGAGIAFAMAIIAFMASQGNLSYSIERNLLYIVIPAAIGVLIITVIANKMKREREKSEADAN